MGTERDDISDRTRAVLARLFGFWFPAGDGAARSIRAVEFTETGEICAAPGARWVPFTAKEVIYATRSEFRWEARLNPGKFAGATVSDEYAGSRGRVMMKIGAIPARRVTGPETDTGELQRYLASAMLCPPILLNNPELKFRAIGPNTLSIGSTENSKASIDMDISADGQPFGCWAVRPRMIGRKMVWEKWSATGKEYGDWERMRVPARLEARWHLREGEFTYFRSNITSRKHIELTDQ